MQRDLGVVLDMLHATEHAVGFRGALDKAGFEGDPKTQSAVLHQLMTVDLPALVNTLKKISAEK